MATYAIKRSAREVFEKNSLALTNVIIVYYNSYFIRGTNHMCTGKPVVKNIYPEVRAHVTLDVFFCIFLLFVFVV